MSDQNLHPTSPEPPDGQGADGLTRGSNRRLVRTSVVVVGLLVVVFATYGMLAKPGSAEEDSEIPTTKVRRGNLTVTVIEGGTLHAMRKLELKSEVEGNNQILELVPEGTVITRQDVADKKVLVRLDTAGMEEKQASQKISYHSTEAAKVQAEKAYEIQVQQNQSNIMASELNVKFAMMEVQRYLGETLAQGLLEQDNPEFISLRRFASIELQSILEPDNPEKALERTREVLGDLFVEVGVGETSELGGAAAQKLREHGSSVQLAEQQLQQAKDTLEWTARLEGEGYVTASELNSDKLRYDSRKVDLDAAEEALRLFVKYDLARDAEQRHSDYKEAQLQLNRVTAQADSELAQAEANRTSRVATFQLEQSRMDKMTEMLDKSIIYATKPGLVVYESTSSGRWGSGDPIQEGSNVRERQTILTIPDLSSLAARVNIHETEVEKLRIGQAARITVEAIPGSNYIGKLARVSPMASSEHRWMNPDVMVYETDVALVEIPANLKPGMSATAEIIIAELEGVLYVPLSAVTTHRGRRVCWVRTGGAPELRELETGHFTDKFVEINGGLREGEVVYLAPPTELPEETAEEREAREQQSRPKQPEQPEQPARSQQAPQPDRDQQPGQAAPSAEAAALRQRMEGLTPEQRQEFFQNLSEEQRSQLRPPGGGRGRQGGRPAGQPREQQ